MATEKFVVVKGSGGAGLGDRLCGLSVGILYAKHTGRTLHVDWRDRAYGSEENNLFPFLFRLVDVPSISHIPSSSNVLPTIWEGRLDMQLDALRSTDLQARGVTWAGPIPPFDKTEAVLRYSIDCSCLDIPEEVVVLWSGFSMEPLLGSLARNGAISAGLSADQMIGFILRRHLCFDDGILEAIRNQWDVLIGNRPSLGVHYRKTDEAMAARGTPSDQQFIAEIDSLIDRMPSDVAIFVSTDNAAALDSFRKRYGVSRVAFFQKWMPSIPGQSIHKNVVSPDALQSARDALVEVGLLARCERMILTGNSSFSCLAAWFSDQPAQNHHWIFPAHGTRLRRLLMLASRRFRQYKLALFS